MPTYEYECVKCNKRFEQFQKMTDVPLKICPDCGAKVRRLIGSGVGLIFKGSGFYCTDYRTKSYKDARNKEQPQPAGENKPISCKNCPKAKPQDK